MKEGKGLAPNNPTEPGAYTRLPDPRKLNASRKGKPMPVSTVQARVAKPAGEVTLPEPPWKDNP